MTQDNRKFSGSISVRIGTKRIKIELSPAEIHDGQPGLFRVRIGRRWVDAPEGTLLFFDRTALASLIAEAALGELEVLPSEPPSLPRNTRVSVKFWIDDSPHQEATWTSTLPIRGYDGKFYVGVMTYAAGFIFVPVEDVIRKDRHGK